MRINPRLKTDIESYLDYVIIVEGEKDVRALKSIGFEKVYPIHQISKPIKERAMEIALQIDKKDKVCILTDFDKKGKTLYLQLKQIFQELGVRLDSTLRGLLLKAGLSHIEGIHKLMENLRSF